MKDIKYWNQLLYVNESGVAEEIEERIHNLAKAAQYQGIKFNEKEFREYMEENKNALTFEEEFDPQIGGDSNA